MSAIAAAVALLVLGGLLAAVWRGAPGERAFAGLVTLGCVLALAAAARVLLGTPASPAELPGYALGGSWAFGMDVLSAAFVLVIAVVGIACAAFGLPYLRGHHAAGLAHLWVALLVASLIGVVTAQAALPFLVAWEVMAFTSYLLIVLDHEHPENRRAGLLYLIATHTATLALFGLFALWWMGAGELRFAALAARPLEPPAGGAVLALALVAFGIKAGAVPLHIWLPEAHAAAPSHVSALMSGVVIKMGIYGLLRVIVISGVPPAWFGWTVLALGGVSGVLGVIWALAQHDLKRLLAFHSVENIGIILLGMGAGCLGMTYDVPVMAVLGFGGAALHTLNHALFKSLLFLGAGAIAHQAGTREIDRLGGLARRMPATGAAFLIGSAAIVGLPPLNGFVSEWLVLRAAVGAAVDGGGARAAVLAVAVLGLIGALALACFAKVVGVIFLGIPRADEGARTHEASAGMVAPLLVLAGACVLIGLLPVAAVPVALRVGAQVAGDPGIARVASGAASAGSAGDSAATLTAFTLGLGTLLGVLALSARLARTRTRAARAQTWGCGYLRPSPRMQYTASSFAAPLLAPFRPVTGLELHRTAATLATHAGDPVLDRLLVPAWRRLQEAAGLLQPMQRTRLSARLLYLEAVLVALLLYLLMSGRPA